MNTILNNIRQYINNNNLNHFLSVNPISQGLATDENLNVTGGVYKIRIVCSRRSRVGASQLSTPLVAVTLNSSNLWLDLDCKASTSTFTDIVSILKRY